MASVLLLLFNVCFQYSSHMGNKSQEWPTIVQTETTEGEKEIVKQEDIKCQQKLYHIITVGIMQ